MTFSLRPNSLIRLQAQMALTSHFHHTLHDSVSGETIQAEIQTERWPDHIVIVIRIGSSVNSLTLSSDEKSNSRRVASHMEAIVNGRLDTADCALTHAQTSSAA